MRWPPWRCRRSVADLDQLRARAQRTAAEARQIAAAAEPALSALERRRPRNGIYEEVLSTLRPKGTA